MKKFMKGFRVVLLTISLALLSLVILRHITCLHLEPEWRFLVSIVSGAALYICSEKMK